MRFENLCTALHAVIGLVKVDTVMTENFTNGHMFYIVEEFSILKAFNIKCHPSNAPKITEVIWIPPNCGRIKCNIDDAAKGSPCPVGVSGIFRDNNAAILGCFASFIGLAMLCMLN